MLVVVAALQAGAAGALDGFTFANRTRETVIGVYASPSRAGDWGTKLNAGPIAPGAEIPVTPASQECRQDVLVEYAGGREETRLKANICGGTSIVWGEAAPPSDDPSFEFINGFGMPVLELYVAQSGQLAGTFDLLITGPVPPRGQFWVAIPPGSGCLLDVALVLADQSRREWSPIETCTVRDITFR